MSNTKGTAVIVFALYALSLSGMAYSADAGAPPASGAAEVCPADPGQPVQPQTSPITSEARIIPAPIPAKVNPPNTDTVTTPNPSPKRRPIVTPVPGVSPVPTIVKTPLTLDQALDVAFRNSPNIRIALDQVERSRGVYREARARFNPTFNVQLTDTEQGPSASFAIGSGPPVEIVPPNVASAGLTVLLPLDISRRLSYSSDIAMYEFQAQYLSMVAASEGLILSVKSAYYDLLRSCGQLDVAQAAVSVAQTRLKNTQDKYTAGTVPLFDLTTAQVDLANLNQQLLSAKNAVYIAQTALNQVLGIDVNTPIQVVKNAIPVAGSSVDIAKNIDTAYARRPEVQAAQSAITLNKTNVKLQRAGLLPSLSINAGPTVNFVPTALSPNSISWQASITLSTPIWDGGVTKARVREAQADVDNSADTLTQTKLGVAQQVRTAALNLQDAALRSKTTADAVALATEALRLANVRYEAGIAVLVEVTNAESQLTQARFNYVNAQYDYAVALAQLQRATSSQPELNQLQLLAGPAAKTK
jgi:outer membrane protein TolC